MDFLRDGTFASSYSGKEAVEQAEPDPLITQRAARRRRERAGRWGEWLVLIHYLCRGYWPQAHRFKTKVGEIDWIVRRGRTLVFIEVKTYRDLTAGLTAIGPQQQHRWLNAARWYLMTRPHQASRVMRFDAVTVHWRPSKFRVKMPPSITIRKDCLHTLA